MKIAAILLSVALFAGSRALALEEHPVKGLVLKVDVENRSLVVSCDSIPGYMDAMEMPFAVQDSKALAALKPGMTVRFTIVEHAKVVYAENIHAGTAANFEPEPVEAGELSALHRAMDPSTVAKIVTVGQQVPDFALIDQAQAQIRLSQLEGKLSRSPLVTRAAPIRTIACVYPITCPPSNGVFTIAPDAIWFC
jgi:protein SCO1